MEASGIYYSTVPSFPPIRNNLGIGFSRELNLGVGDSRISAVRPRNNSWGRLSCQFSDSGHVQFYISPRVGGGCGGGDKKKEKEKSSEIKRVKKKLKFMKRLSKDLSMLSQMAEGQDINIGLIGEVKVAMISEAKKVLYAQLQQLKSEQKEHKRKLKEEKARLKATMEGKSESSSSSSESSDCDCGKVVDMKTLRSNVLESSKIILAPKQQPEAMEGAAIVTKEAATLANSLAAELEDLRPKISLAAELEDLRPKIRIQVPEFGSECCSPNGFKDDLAEGTTSTKKIEICMGGKCKKLGAPALLEEFERKVGAEANVVACKCMGKCKTAPNVKVLNSPGRTGNEDSVFGLGINNNPICTGVGLQDVDMIIANLIGKDLQANLKGNV